MIAVIGIILLIGIVKKNAIMMIDFALDAEREQGLSPREAIFQACLLRFRPILMTTLAALLGALPLMLGNGVGQRAAPAAGPDDGGRADREPAADAVHHAGHLFGLCRAGRAVEAPRQCPGGRMNLSSVFIHRPVATTLLTLGLALAGTSASSCCRWRHCRRWTSPPFRSQASCPVPAPRPWPPRWPRRWSARWGPLPGSTKSRPAPLRWATRGSCCSST
jgi:hypothetical protein